MRIFSIVVLGVLALESPRQRIWVAHFVLSQQSTQFVYGTVYIRDQQAFSTKGKIENILGFAGHSASVVTSQLCHCSVLSL